MPSLLHARQLVRSWLLTLTFNAVHEAHARLIAWLLRNYQGLPRPQKLACSCPKPPYPASCIHTATHVCFDLMPGLQHTCSASDRACCTPPSWSCC